MKAAPLVIATAFTMLAIGASAQSTKKQLPPGAPAKLAPPASWAAEPNAILGLKLGVPIDESKLPMCPRPGYETVVCLDAQAVGTGFYYVLRGHPFAYAKGIIGIDSEGIVSGLSMDMPQENFGDFVRVLRERYGPPSAASVDAVQSKAGATFITQTLTWSGIHMQILALERNDRVDRATVIFSDNAATARGAAKRDARTKAEASKL